jgi:hypothetical protein
MSIEHEPSAQKIEVQSDLGKNKSSIGNDVKISNDRLKVPTSPLSSSPLQSGGSAHKDVTKTSQAPIPPPSQTQLKLPPAAPSSRTDVSLKSRPTPPPPLPTPLPPLPPQPLTNAELSTDGDWENVDIEDAERAEYDFADDSEIKE